MRRRRRQPRRSTPSPGPAPDYLLDFRPRYPGRHGRRAGPQLPLHAAGRRASPTGRSPGPAAGRRPPAGAGRPAAGRPRARATPSYPDEPAEAERRGAASAALDRRRASRPREIAVLFRTNAQSETYEQALADAGVPYLCAAPSGSSTGPRCAQAVLLLRGAARGDDGRRAARSRLARAVLSGEGWTQRAAGRRRGRPRALGVAGRAGRAGRGLRRGRTRRQLADLVAELDDGQPRSTPRPSQGVTLASLHAAKGLEWDAVFLVGVAEGMMPITYAEGPTPIEEERRLLYVGVTRARERLHAVLGRRPHPGRPRHPRAVALPRRAAPRRRSARAHARARAGGVERAAAARRRVAPALPRAAAPAASLTAPSARSAAARTARRPTTRRLFERLRAWRLAGAREASVPAYVVFTDATLMAIAESAPADEGDCSRISGVGARKLDAVRRRRPGDPRGCGPARTDRKRSAASESAE